MARTSLQASLDAGDSAARAMASYNTQVFMAVIFRAAPGNPEYHSEPAI